jgi:hypothetical protein
MKCLEIGFLKHDNNSCSAAGWSVSVPFRTLTALLSLDVALNVLVLLWLTTDVIQLGPKPATLADMTREDVSTYVFLFPLLNLIAVVWTPRPDPEF